MTAALNATRFAEVPIKRLFRIVNGGTPASDDRFWGGDIVWVTPADLASVDGSAARRSSRTLTREGLTSGSTLVPTGSLVLSTRAPIGYVARSEVQLATNQGCKSLVPAVTLDTRYFQYVLLGARATLQASGNGTTFMELAGSVLGRIRVPTPPPQQQKRIADYIDAETVRIDELVAEQEQQLRLIAERRHSLISTAAKARVGRSPSQLHEALQALPQGWRLVPLRSVASIQSGLTLGKTYDGPLEERPYLRVANVQDGSVDLSEVSTIEVPRSVALGCELRAGDVLMTEGGDNDKLGRGTVWQSQIQGCLHQNHIFAVRPDRALLRPRYLALLTASSWGRAYFMATAHQTTNLAATNRAKVGRFPVPLPPLEEQDELLVTIDEELTQLDLIETELARQVSLLRERRQALITHAVTHGIEGLPGVA